MAEQAAAKGRALGINHLVLEVGDIEEALAFYGALFEFTLRGRSETQAFIDLGNRPTRSSHAHLRHPPILSNFYRLISSF